LLQNASSGNRRTTRRSGVETSKAQKENRKLQQIKRKRSEDLRDRGPHIREKDKIKAEKKNGKKGCDFNLPKKSRKQLKISSGTGGKEWGEWRSRTALDINWVKDIKKKGKSIPKVNAGKEHPRQHNHHWQRIGGET